MPEYQQRDPKYNEYKDMKEQIISNGKYLIVTSSKRHPDGAEDLSEGLDVVVRASDNKCPNKEYRATLITRDGYALAEGKSVRYLNAAMEDLLRLTAAVVTLKKPQWESQKRIIHAPKGDGAFGEISDILL